MKNVRITGSIRYGVTVVNFEGSKGMYAAVNVEGSGSWNLCAVVDGEDVPMEDGFEDLDEVAEHIEEFENGFGCPTV